MKKNPQKILIVRTDRIGDLVLSTPVITNLRKSFPQSHIAFMCRPYTKSILENNPYLDEIIVYDKYHKHRGFWASFKLAYLIRRRKFDWAIILHPTNRVNLITFFAGIPLRLGWDSKLGFLLTRRLRYIKHEGQKHECDYTLDLLKALNLKIQDRELYLKPSKFAESYIEDLFKEAGVNKGDILVALGIGSSCISKRWPVDRFLQTAEGLRAKFSNIKIFILGDRTERRLAEPFWKKECPDYIDLVGKMDLEKLVAFFSRIDLLICNDCGLAHICSAVKMPVISIFGRNQPGLSPLRWRPLGEKSYFLHEPPDCVECLAHNCKKGFICLERVKADKVLALAYDILENS